MLNISLYSAVIFIEVLAAVLMILMILSNSLVGKRMKKYYSALFVTLEVAALCEWLNVCLNGSPENYRLLHYVVKTGEFCFMPMALGLGIMALEPYKYKKQLISFLIFNALFEIVSAFNGFVFYMDEANRYVRGQYYFIYVLCYSVLILIFCYQFRVAGKKYQGHNPYVLISGGVFISFGVCVQLINPEIRTAFLAAELSLIFCYIYVTSLMLQTDKITGLLNRWSYEKKLETVNYATVILIFDVDNFKTINDSFGHRVGDSCLKIAASLVLKCFAKEASCYRIGGDEFCAVFKKCSRYSLKQSEERMKAMLERFQQEISDIRKIDPRFTGISVGYAFTEKGIPVQFAIEQADRMMYENKEAKKH